MSILVKVLSKTPLILLLIVCFFVTSFILFIGDILFSWTSYGVKSMNVSLSSINGVLKWGAPIFATVILGGILAGIVIVILLSIREEEE